MTWGQAKISYRTKRAVTIKEKNIVKLDSTKIKLSFH